MIKYLLFIILIQNIEQNESKIYKKGPLLSNNNNIDQREWKSLWFPNPPNYHYDDVTELEKDNVADNGNKNDEWAGTWFPHQPGKSDNVVKSDEDGDSIPWTGTWFPHLPGKQTESDNHECDNGKVWKRRKGANRESIIIANIYVYEYISDKYCH